MSVNVFTEWMPGQGPREAAAKLAALEISIRVGGFRQPLKRSVDEVLSVQIKRNFDTESAGGRPWPKLSQSTVAIKSREGRNNGILKRTMELRNTATTPSRFKISKDEAIYNMPRFAFYGVFHLTGFYNHRSNTFVPARDWLALSPDATSKVAAIFDDWVESKIKAVF